MWKPRSLSRDLESALCLCGFCFCHPWDVGVLVFFVLSTLFLSPYTLLHRVFPMSRVSVNRGEAEDIVEMVWPVFGSWWPSWSVCSMTLSSLFFQVSDSPALFITRLDQQLLTDSLSVMHPFWVSLWSTAVCFANEIYKEWIQESEWGRGSTEHFKYHPRRGTF